MIPQNGQIWPASHVILNRIHSTDQSHLYGGRNPMIPQTKGIFRETIRITRMFLGSCPFS